MEQSIRISSPLLYRCFCACAGFILVSSDYTINLIGLYPVIDNTIAYIKDHLSFGNWYRYLFVFIQTLALSLIS